MSIQEPVVDLSQPRPDEKRRFPVFSKRHTTTATVLALLAWTVAVFDYGLFGTLLPAMQQEFGWSAPEAYAINTWIAVGTAIVCFGIGPVIDRLGRRKGMMTTIGGTAVVSGLTALIPTGIPFFSNAMLVVVRSFGGLGFSEQAVNATYMNEVYQVTEVADKRKRPGFHYSFIQGGWPLGFLLASALALAFLPSLGWRALYLMATVPAAVIVWVIARKLKETPQFELHHKLTELEKHGKTEDAHSLAHAYGVEHSSAAPLKRIWEPHLRRNTFVFSLAWIVNFFGITIFSVLGSSVLKNAKGVELSDAFWMLIVINLLAYFGYVFHGWLGDKIGRKRTIIGGWILSGISFSIMLSPIATSPFMIILTYGAGLFFLVGPYAAIQYFMAECYPVSCRATGTAFIGAMSQPGTILGGAIFTAIAAGAGTGTAALWVGALGTLVSGLLMIAAKPPAEALMEDHPHDVA
ncbi:MULTISPECIES: MFS transporter [Micrococcaceae]|uniref:MFS transporter n=1 Tax=Micrococcaceae TaxID=1268 RepID=UPI0012F06DE6|nr:MULTISPECIES: MFS transporter [Micrococcaceae]UTT70546.1 MFS transporter [Arthrobacter sp. DNA4]WRT14973.1 MFS transporter [Pseudarthrobacter sp. LT1]VXB82574.1 MFS transporter [Arthrobacter sp. 8AJ]